MVKKNTDLYKVTTFLLVGIFIGIALSQGYGLLSQYTGDTETYVAKNKEIQESPQEITAKTAEPKVDVSVDDDAVLGDKNAPVTIVEFSDFECPFCKRYHQGAYQDIITQYVETGKVKIVYRDFPLSFHDPLASQQAIAAECIADQLGDEKYYEYSDLIFANTNSNGNGMEKDKLYELAAEVGAKEAKFAECLDNEEFADEVAADIADGRAYGVSGTPTNFVNGQQVIGAQPFSVFQALIEAELNK